MTYLNKSDLQNLTLYSPNIVAFRTFLSLEQQNDQKKKTFFLLIKNKTFKFYNSDLLILIFPIISATMKFWGFFKRKLCKFLLTIYGLFPIPIPLSTPSATHPSRYT